MKRTYTLIALCFFVLAGCNVFDGLYEEGTSNDPAVLEKDADFALERSEPEKAVQYLEKALQKAPDSPTVRTKLSTALMQANDIDVLKMIELADELTGTVNNKSGGSSIFSVSFATSSQACNFTGTPKEQIDLSATAAYSDLSSVQDVIERVHNLLAPVVSDPEKLNALEESLKDSALLNDSISRILTVILAVEKRRLEDGIELYRLENDNVGFCGNDEASLTDIQVFVKCEEIPELSSALDLLRSRLPDTTQGSEATDAIDELQNAIDQLQGEIQVSCS